jgi:hypothetical protein
LPISRCTRFMSKRGMGCPFEMGPRPDQKGTVHFGMGNGNGKREMGNAKREMGSGEWGMGNGKWEMGNAVA